MPAPTLKATSYTPELVMQKPCVGRSLNDTVLAPMSSSTRLST